MLAEILKYKKTIIGVVVVVVLFVFYNSFLKPDVSTEVLERNTLAPEHFPAAREILTLLVDLRALQLSGEIFSRPAFQNLEDFSIPIQPEPQGRENPFAPLGAEPVETGEEEES